MDNAVFAVTGRRAAWEFPRLASREEDAGPDPRPEHRFDSRRRNFPSHQRKRTLPAMVETAPPSPSGRRARDLAAATPETRNRYADLLRVASIFVVVIGHWLMAVLEYEDGSFVGKNLLEIATWTHILTWIFQVMPIFFIVGGFTNAGSWRSASRRGVSYATWLRGRSARLLGPALVFVAFWTVLP